MPLAGVHRPLQGRARAVEVHRQLARLHIKRHKVAVDIHPAQLHLAEQLRTFHIAAQTQTGVEPSLCLFTASENRVDHRQREVADIDVAAEITPPLRVGDLHLPIQLTIVGQADKPAQLGAIVMQVGAEVQRIECHRQRRVVDHLGHLDVAPAEGHFALRQPLFGGVPAHIGITGKHAAGLGRLRHKRLKHRQIEAVEVHSRPPAGARVDGLRDAKLGVRVGPAVWPNADFLLLVAVVQRNAARQRYRPYRRLEAGIAQRASPAFGLTIEAACQRQLAGNRIALHAQPQLMLLLSTFGIELHQTDIDPRLANAIYPHVQVTANLIGGFHVPFDVDLGDRQFLPAQRPGGDVGQQLRRIDSAAHFYQALRRPAEPRQRIIQVRRIDGGVEIKILHPQLAFDISAVRA